jgi:hypothetical protein
VAAGRYGEALTSYQRSLTLFLVLGDHDKVGDLRETMAKVQRLAVQAGSTSGGK